MDKIDKALRKLSSKELGSVKKVLKMLSSGDVDGLDVKKLKGRDDIYRARKGQLRIIYRQRGGSVYLLTIDRRDEGTYKNL